MNKCRKCNVELNINNFRDNNGNICRNCENIRNRLRTLKNKIDILEHYGNSCKCCGEVQPICLTVDHISENGSEHRKAIKCTAGSSFYSWLKKQGYPQDNYQILCFNCNYRKFASNTNRYKKH